MQKFKIQSSEILRIYCEFMNTSPKGSYMVEGELLEGGTVEIEEENGYVSCENRCYHTRQYSKQCLCPCHNKKEEWERLFDLNYHDKEKLKTLFAQAIDGKFNRETPKLPKHIIWDSHTDSLKTRDLYRVVNEILDYLKARE